jgi:hypothetical protein
MEGPINQGEDMSNKVDKLFKEKLEGHSLQPSAQAWEKLEAHLGKKNKIVLWTRVAAAVILLGLLTFAGINWNSEVRRQESEVGSKESGVGSKESGVGSQESGVGSQESEVRRQEATNAVAEKRKVTRKQGAEPKIATRVAEEAVEEIAIVPEEEVTHETQPGSQPDLTPHTSHPTPHTAHLTPEKGITLTYSLPAVKKQEAPAEPVVAQVAEQKKTGFERVIEIAKEVKNGDALGELRQAKDDIFALDFKKDKDKKKQ